MLGLDNGGHPDRGQGGHGQDLQSSVGAAQEPEATAPEPTRTAAETCQWPAEH